MAWIATWHTTISSPSGFPLPVIAQQWPQRPPPKPVRRQRHECGDEQFDEPDWIMVGDRRMIVVDYTPHGAPFGCYEDELEDLE